MQHRIVVTVARLPGRELETQNAVCLLPRPGVGSPETAKDIHGSMRGLLGDYTRLVSCTGLQVCLSKGTVLDPFRKTIEIS